MPHIHEKIDFTVEVFIVHKNKVLLRMHDKHNIWLSVGGHIELDEDPVTAAHREVKEEVGLDVKILGKAEGPIPGAPENMHYSYLIPPRYLGKHPVSKDHTHIVFVYFATAENEKISEAVSEHERRETRWVSKEEMESMNLVPNVQFYAEEALKAANE
jgi:8-oxo-dGTP diphosphatase